MKIKVFLSVLIVAFVAECAAARTWYSRSYSDYMQKKWVLLDSVKIKFEQRSGNSKYWSGGGDFNIKTGDEATDKLLDKDVRFVLHNDSLYVNCRGLRCGDMLGEGYTLGYRFEKDKVVFSIDENMEGGIFVNIAQAIKNTLSPQDSPRTGFLMQSDSKVVKELTVLEMEALLEPYPNKLYEYKTLPEQEKELFSTIYRFFTAVRQLYPY